jgi:hypothetical protein
MSGKKKWTFQANNQTFNFFLHTKKVWLWGNCVFDEFNENILIV